MLDLTMMNNELYEVRLLDGKELQLKRPTQKMYEEILLLNEKKETDRQTLRIFSNVFASILNRNVEGIEYKAAELANDYDLAVMGVLIKDYFSFWNNELTEKINFQ